MEADSFYSPQIFNPGVELRRVESPPPRATAKVVSRLRPLIAASAIAGITATGLLAIPISRGTLTIGIEAPLITLAKYRGNGSLSASPVVAEVIIGEPIALAKSRRVVAFRRVGEPTKAVPRVSLEEWSD